MKIDTTKLNIPLLLRVKTLILDEPRRFDMNRWADSATYLGLACSVAEPPCGTVGCIAYLTLVADGMDAKEIQNLSCSCIPKQAAALLGLEYDSISDVDFLFYVADWPTNLAERYTELQNEINDITEYLQNHLDSDTSEEADRLLVLRKLTANLAAERIDYLISHGE